jgi:hypothetical protein
MEHPDTTAQLSRDTDPWAAAREVLQTIELFKDGDTITVNVADEEEWKEKGWTDRKPAAPEPDAPEPTKPIDKMKVDELKAALVAKGFDIDALAGLPKAQLVEMLTSQTS